MRLVLLFCCLLALGPTRALAGDFETGEQLFNENCAACHGEDGRTGSGYNYPIWGEGTGIQKYNTALGLFQYLQLLMPYDDPYKINDEQKWLITKYMLMQHGTLPRGEPVDPNKAGEIEIK
jgi:cytochrome c